MATRYEIKRGYDWKISRQDKMKLERQAKQRHLWLRTMLGVFVAGTALPGLAAAVDTTITPTTGFTGTTVKTTGNVTTVETTKIIEKTAINVFDQYTVGANHIANMYFGTKSGNSTATNLVNVVNSHIDIEGTVNAVQSNKIGGNLYFLSSNGMAVSKTGVINAGSLHIFTPSADAMTTLKGNLIGDKASDTEAATTIKTYLDNTVSLNPEGTISVQGTIHATDGISLRAPHIQIGSADDPTAVLQTGVTDFSSVVNIDAEARKIDAGLGTGLTAAVADGSGDIVLEAKTGAVAVKDVSNIKNIGDKLGLDVTKEDIAKFFKGQFAADVAVYGTVTAVKDATISATAANATNSQIAETVASVTIGDGSKITAAHDVTVTAAATNAFTEKDAAIHSKNIKLNDTAVPITADVTFAVLTSTATVDIAKTAELTAGNDVNVKAASTISGSIGTTVTLDKDGTPYSAYIPVSGVTYVQADNTAAVTVDGTLTSTGTKSADGKTITGSVNVDATTGINLNISTENKYAVAPKKSADAEEFILAVGVTNVTNNATTTIGEDALLTVQGKDGAVNVTSNNTNSFTDKVTVAATDGSALVTAVNVVNYDNNANTVMNGTIQSANDINVKATNTVDTMAVTAGNSIGASDKKADVKDTDKDGNKVDGKEQTSALMKQLKKESKDLLGELPFKVKTDDESKASNDSSSGTSGTGNDTGTANTTGFALTDYLDFGAAVTIGNVGNTATVTVGNKEINGKGSVSIAAKSAINDSNFAATGKSSPYKKDDGTTVVANASVLYAGLKNNASVKVSAATADAKTIHGKNVSITSEAKKNYGRIDKMTTDLKKKYDELEKSIEAFKKDIPEALSKDWETFKGKYTKLYNDLQSSPLSSTEDILKADTWKTWKDGFMKDAEDALSQVTNFQKTLKESETGKVLNEDVSKSLTNLMNSMKSALQFTHYENYADFMTNSAVAGSVPTTGSTSKLALVGNVDVVHVDNTAQTLIGSGRTINADAALAVTSANNATFVTLAGINKLLFGVTNADEAAAIGGTVNIQKVNNRAFTGVDAGASLTAGSIDVQAGNTSGVYSGTMSSGKGGTAINGMFAYVGGNNDALAVVDDNAKLTAAKVSGVDAATGVVTIGSANDTSVVNVAGGLASGSGAAAVGVAVAVNNLNAHSQAVLGDINTNLKDFLSADDITALGLDSTITTAGVFSVQGLNVTADTTGAIETITVAGALSRVGSQSSSSGSGSEAAPAAGDKAGTLDSIGEGVSDDIAAAAPAADANGAPSAITDKVESKDNPASDKAGDSDISKKMNINGVDQGGGKVNADSQKGQSGTPAFTLTGAGSVSVNRMYNSTTAKVSGVTVNLNSEKMNVIAKDNALIVAASGAAAVNWQNGGSGNGTEVAFAGAAGVNRTVNTINSVVENSTINQAKEANATAVSGGKEIALGLGLTVSKTNAGSTGYQGGASVSVGLTDHTVNALMDNTKINTVGTVPAGSAVSVTAYESDTQVTGGATVAAGNSKAMIGGAFTMGKINNTLSAKINGGEYHAGSLTVQGLDALTDVTAAASLGVDVSGQGMAFMGAVAYNKLTNHTDAAITGGAVISNNTATTVNAQDLKKGNALAAPYESLLSTSKNIKDQVAEAQKTGVDLTGATYYESLDTSNVKKDDTSTVLNLNNTGRQGSTIVSAAASLAGTGNTAAGAAIAIDDITNSFTATISDSTLTSDSVSATATSDTFLVGVAGGIAASGKFGGMGSVSWQDIANTAKTNITDSTITTGSLTAEATNSAIMTNVAGQVSASGKVAAGAVLAYNGLNNTTGVYLSGNTLQAQTAATGLIIDSEALSSASLYSIGVNVAASGSVALAGTVAINEGGNHTEVIIDKSDKKASAMTNVKSLTAKASDNTTLATTLVGITGSGTVAAGAGVAYTSIGGSSSDPAASKQNVRAQVNNTDVTTLAGTSLGVSAHDTSENITTAIGIGGSGTVAVQGAAATSLTNKNVEASLNATDIDKATADANRAKLVISADNTSDNYTTAIVAAGSGTAAVGAGVSVNRTVQTTQASLTGGTQHVDNASIASLSQPSITAVGIGGTGAGTVAIAGSFGVNTITNDTKTLIDNVTLISQGNIGVVSQSDEYITNIVGSVTGAGAVAIGLSTTVNTINGSTDAIVTNSTLTAKGSSTDAINEASDVADTALLSDYVEKGTFDAKKLKNGRNAKTKTGLVIDSSATHSIGSTVFSAGGSGTVAVLGVVNVNNIGGDTMAKLYGSDVNQGLTPLTAGDVSVHAADYVNSAGLTGLVAVSGVAAAGVANDTNLVTRHVQANVNYGSDDAEKALTAKHAITANTFAVDAIAKQAMSFFDVGACVGGNAGLAGTISIAKLDGTTDAVVNKSIIDAVDMEVQADHLGRAYMGGVNASGSAIGAAVGLNISVAKLNDTTAAVVSNSQTTTSGDTSVMAQNQTELQTVATTVAFAVEGVAAAGSIVVDNFSNTVNAEINNGSVAAGRVKVEAENMTNTKMIEGQGSVGLIGAGAGVSVGVNTFDSTVSAQTINTAITATGTDIDNGADEYATSAVQIGAIDERVVSQTVNNVSGGFGALGVNVMETVAGTDVKTEEDNQARAKIKYANQMVVLANDNNKDSMIGLNQAEKKGVAQARTASDQVKSTSDIKHVDLIDDPDKLANLDKIRDEKEKAKVKAEQKKLDNEIQAAKEETDPVDLLGGNKEGAGTYTTISGSTLNAANGTVYVISGEGNDISMTGGSVAVGAVSLNGSVGILELNHKTTTSVSDSTLTGKNLEIRSTLSDVSTDEKTKGAHLTVYQGSGAIVNLGAAVGRETVTGASRIYVTDSDLTATTDNILLYAVDDSTAHINAYGISAGAVAGGAVTTEVTNTSTTSVAITATKKKTIAADNGYIIAVALKQNDVQSYAYGGAYGAAGIAGLKATATDTGVADLSVNGSNYTLQSKSAELAAVNLSKVDVQAINRAGGAVAEQVSKAIATENADATLTVAADNTFNTDYLVYYGLIGDEDTIMANAKVVGTSIGAAACIS